jgi:hypothetical protein
MTRTVVLSLRLPDSEDGSYARRLVDLESEFEAQVSKLDGVELDGNEVGEGYVRASDSLR